MARAVCDLALFCCKLTFAGRRLLHGLTMALPIEISPNHHTPFFH